MDERDDDAFEGWLLRRRGDPLAVPPEESLSATFTSIERSCDWSSPERLQVSAIFGDVKLDFRRAEIPHHGVVEIDAHVLFGEVKIRVPPGTRVRLGGTWAIFGEIAQKRAADSAVGRSLRRLFGRGDGPDPEDEFDPHEEPMLLRLEGSALFGSIVVEVG